MNFKDIIFENEQLSDVDVEEGKMSDILGVDEDETIEDGYDGSAQEAAQDVVDAVGEDEAASMINYAANISGDSFLNDMQDALKDIDEQFREVVRQFIQQEIDEATTTAAVPGYQTPFAFGDKEDEKKEDDIEEFLDTYGWEMAELAKKFRENELTEGEKEKVKSYIRRVRSMRDDDVSGYQKKSNYYPHNMSENFTEKQLKRWAEEGAPEDASAVVRSPNGEERTFEDYLRQTVHEQARQLLTEGAYFDFRYFPDMSKDEMHEKWKKKTKRVREPRNPYRKNIKHFSRIGFPREQFDTFQDAKDYLLNNTDKWNENVKAVKVTQPKEGGRGPDFAKEGPYWLVGTWISE